MFFMLVTNMIQHELSKNNYSKSLFCDMYCEFSLTFKTKENHRVYSWKFTWLLVILKHKDQNLTFLMYFYRYTFK